MSSPSSTPYTTRDVAVAAVLGLHGVYPQSITAAGTQGSFTFESTPYLRELVDAYERGSLSVSAKMFVLVSRDYVAQLRRATAAENAQ